MGKLYHRQSMCTVEFYNAPKAPEMSNLEENI